MEDLRELQRFQIEALQKENASLKSQIQEATELLKEILKDLQS